MRIGVLGTGTVGQTISAKLVELSHDVMLGTRDVTALMARVKPGMGGTVSFAEWHKRNPKIKVGTFPEAAAHGGVAFNCTAGNGALSALRLAGEANLNGKVLIDISNSLDFSRGMPPTLSVCNTDSLGEQIQRAFPATRVVKTLNTTNAKVMVNPAQLAGGDHTVFVSGNDAEAKATVAGLLKSFGWKDIIDLGDITTARGAEMLMPIWLRLWGAGVLKSPMFNFKVVR